MRIEVKNLRHVYSPGTDFEKVALEDASLTVEEGEILAIVGGTGSGKSTLVTHLNLLLEPTGGEILIDGTDAKKLRKSELRRRVGLVFQFPEAALFAPTVREDVAFAPQRMGLSASEVDERVDGVLGMLGIAHLAERSPFALSGGERRRVAIAGVLAMVPEVVVLDEPTAGLDPLARDGLLEVVRELAEAGVSVVFVSHDLNEVAEVADRVCVMERGRVRAIGSPQEVFYEDGISAPDTVRVASRVAALTGRDFDLENPATGNITTGNSATGNSATGNSATGNSATGNPVTFAETVAALRRVTNRGSSGEES